VTDIPDDLKAAYSAQAAARKAKAIERGALTILLEKKALEAFLELWDSWVSVLGKEVATDNLIEGMIRQHEVIRARLTYQLNGGKVQWIRVSAPKLAEEFDDRESEGQDDDDEAPQA
jgi:nicotinamide mononucleotide adenylyltransferase